VPPLSCAWRIFDRTDGHLLPDAADHERGLLDAFDAREAVSAESFWRGLGAGE
jgi:hypothetical protein